MPAEFVEENMGFLQDNYNLLMKSREISQKNLDVPLRYVGKLTAVNP